jgi:hypothetical protein
LARYHIDLETKKPAADVKRIIQEFMRAEGFAPVIFNQEPVWKRGMGILTGPQFLRTEVTDGKVHLEAWIKFALLPGVYVGEMGITGFFGYALKAVLRKRVTNLQKLITE